MIKEEWRVIEDFPEYSISNMGEVINHKTGKPRTVRLNNTGSLVVNLSDGAGRTTRSVAGLVARYFMEADNPNDDTPIQLNGDRADCRVTNMVLRPRWFAVDYHRQFVGSPMAFDKRVLCIDTDEDFEDCREAAQMYGMLERDIFVAVHNGSTVYPHFYEFALLDDRFDND